MTASIWGRNLLQALTRFILSMEVASFLLNRKLGELNAVASMTVGLPLQHARDEVIERVEVRRAGRPDLLRPGHISVLPSSQSCTWWKVRIRALFCWKTYGPQAATLQSRASPYADEGLVDLLCHYFTLLKEMGQHDVGNPSVTSPVHLCTHTEQFFVREEAKSFCSRSLKGE